MSLPHDESDPIESQLRDWGNRLPNAADSSKVTLEGLVSRRELKSRRFQNATTWSVMVGSVILVSWIATFVVDKSPLITAEQNTVATNNPAIERPDSFLPPSTEAQVPSNTVLATKSEYVDRELQVGWMEAKRADARERVLQQWLAENL